MLSAGCGVLEGQLTRSRRVRVFLCVLALVVVSAPSLRGTAQDEARFAGATHLVVVHVSVTDRDGGYRAGLPKEAFTILEDGVPQQVSFFSNEEMPATVGVLVDSSISMWSIRDRVVSASAEFAHAGNPEDEMFALAFNDQIRSALPPEAPFTSDVETLRAALGAVVTGRGRTALFDAISEGISYGARGTHPRKVLVLLSDGGDNASKTTLESVLTKTQTSNVIIYTVALFDPTAPEANPKLLERLAATTGGLAVKPDGSRGIPDALQRISREIRQSYVLGYTPSRQPDGAFRRVQVVVNPPDRRRVIVRARQGYLAPPAQP